MKTPLTTLLRCVVMFGLSLLLTSCTRLFFYPMKEHVTTPLVYGYQYQDVYLTTEDNLQVHAWLIEPKTTTIGTIYFLHGNAENISTHFRATLWLLNQGYRVFALDYRGYGLSDGQPDVPEVFLDIQAGTRWLVTHAASDSSSNELPIYLYGQSLGGSLAAKYAQLDKTFSTYFNGLIIEAAFSRYGTIAQHVASNHWLTWSLQYPANWLMTDQYDPVDAVRALDGIPKLFIHSREDTIIPYRFGESLFAASAEPKQWMGVSGPHIRAAAEETVRLKMIDFMHQHANRGTLPTL